MGKVLDWFTTLLIGMDDEEEYVEVGRRLLGVKRYAVTQAATSEALKEVLPPPFPRTPLPLALSSSSSSSSSLSLSALRPSRPLPAPPCALPPSEALPQRSTKRSARGGCLTWEQHGGTARALCAA